jgi:tetratricopeptide (TPR) repeat protein
MRRWPMLLSCLALLALPASAQQVPVPDTHPCFSDNMDRRIAGCSELIATPGIDTATRSQAFAMRALGYSLLGQYETAIQDYNTAIRMMPDFAVALNNRAWAYFKWGKSSTGLPDVEKSLRLDPSSYHAYDTRAHIHQSLGDPAAAMRDYEKAMILGGQRFVKLYQCGLAMAKLYSGPTDGIYSAEMRRALQVCVNNPLCDPLPPDEDCRPTTS